VLLWPKNNAKKVNKKSSQLGAFFMDYYLIAVSSAIFIITSIAF
jgi:hypothetical protein